MSKELKKIREDNDKKELVINWSYTNPDNHSESDKLYHTLKITKHSDGTYSYFEDYNDDSKFGFRTVVDTLDDALYGEYGLSELDGFKIEKSVSEIKAYFNESIDNLIKSLHKINEEFKSIQEGYSVHEIFRIAEKVIEDKFSENCLKYIDKIKVESILEEIVEGDFKIEGDDYETNLVYETPIETDLTPEDLEIDEDEFEDTFKDKLLDFFKDMEDSYDDECIRKEQKFDFFVYDDKYCGLTHAERMVEFSEEGLMLMADRLSDVAPYYEDYTIDGKTFKEYLDYIDEEEYEYLDENIVYEYLEAFYDYDSENCWKYLLEQKEYKKHFILNEDYMQFMEEIKDAVDNFNEELNDYRNW